MEKQTEQRLEDEILKLYGFENFNMIKIKYNCDLCKRYNLFRKMIWKNKLINDLKLQVKK